MNFVTGLHVTVSVFCGVITCIIYVLTVINCVKACNQIIALCLGVSTRGNQLKIYQDHVQYNLRKYFFSNKVIQIWNSLPDFVIDIHVTKISFKNKLDKFWANENVKFSWRSNLTGSGAIVKFIIVS